MNELDEIVEKIIDFRNRRDWEKFHSLKNLSSSISIEASELMEFFQWTDPIPDEINDEKKEKIKHEVADILIYLILFSEKLDINLIEAVKEKMKINEKRFLEGIKYEY